MTLGKAFAYSVQKLKSACIEDAITDSLVLLCHVLRCDKSYLFTHFDCEFDIHEYDAYNEFIVRRVKNEPIAYIIGKCEFMSLKFYVNKSILIPRPETEILVEEVIKLIRKPEDRIISNILDIGTGSGCVAISLAKYIENCYITAIDISEDALIIARKNTILNNVENRISFLQGDLFSNALLTGRNNLYDFVVSNPPYIKSSLIKKLQPEVSAFQPLCALDGGEDGLSFYRRIIDDIAKYLKCGGYLALETGYDQANMVAGFMKSKFANIRITKDFSGIQRVVTGEYQIDS